MKCVVLAAGYATRLYPLTENFPKPLLEIKGKTILDWLLEDIHANCGIDSFVVVSNHKFVNHFEEWKKSKSFDITVLDDGSMSNETRIGAVKDIQFAIDSLSLEEDLLVIAGDNVLDFSFSSFVEFYKEKGTSCIMKYYEETLKEGKKYCVTETDSEDKVIYMKEKVENPTSHYLVPPFYIYRKEDLPLVKKSLAEGCPYDAPGSLVEWMCRSVPFYSMTMPGKRYDVGNLEGYRKICEEYQGITSK
jgi:glucose-1-phosphate thymidylyltransferase